MVGVSGVSSDRMAGHAVVTAGGAGVTTASALAAYPQLRQDTKVSSPVSATARNSSEADPPIAPDMAATTTYRSPTRSKIRT